MPRNTANDLCERGDGRILVASDRGMLIFDPTTHAISRLHLVDPLGRRLDSIPVHSLFHDSRGNLWMGTGTEGMFKLEPHGRKVLNYRHREGDSSSISSDYITDIVEGQHGNLWIAAQKEVDLFSPVTGHRTPYLPFGRAPQRSGGNHLVSVDRTGTIWIGTVGDGVYWLSPKSQRFPNYSLRDVDGSPRTFETIERSHDGTFWFSSVGKLFQIDVTTHRALKTIDVFRGRKQTLRIPDNSMSMLDEGGIFWYGTWGLGLYKINLSTGQIKNYS